MNLVSYSDLNAALMGGATGAGGVLNGAKVHLTKAALDIDGSTALADLTAIEADFAGYAAKVITWLAPSISDAGNHEQVGTVPEFRPTGATVENLCHDLFVVDATGTKLLFAGPIGEQAIPMAATTDSLLVTLRYQSEALASTVVVS